MGDRVVFIFSGFSGKLVGYPKEKIVRNLRARGYDIHFLTNTCKDLFITGGDDFLSAEALAEFLREERAKYAEALTLCSSGGGFGGIALSMAAGIETIAGYSAFTTLDTAAREIDGRGKRLHRWFDKWLPDPETQNLKWHIAEQAFEGQIVLHYPAESPKDSYQAENLRGCPGVTLLPMPTSKHGMRECKGMPFSALEARGLIAPKAKQD